jgi:hypothetical protein
VSKIADLIVRVDIDVEQRTAASQDQGRFRSFLLVGLQKSAHRKVREHVPIVAEDGFVFFQKVLDVLESSSCVQKNRFMAEKDGGAPPAPIRKFLCVDVRAVMGIYDKAIHANLQEMVHREGNDGSSSDLQERLGASLCQGAEPRAQPGTQDKRCLEPPLFQRPLSGIMEKWNTGILEDWVGTAKK